MQVKPFFMAKRKMASPWCRLWSDMPNDPKWRTIARLSNQSIGNVIAVYVHMMTCASSQPNATERGRTLGWRDEDIATALDLETAQIEAIREAMQGRVRDGDYLLGWDRRQSIREDEGAADRARAFREREKAKKLVEQQGNHSVEKAIRTQPNATERGRTTDVDVDVDVDKDVDVKEKNKTKASPVGDAEIFHNVDPQVVADFKALRKQKRAPITKTAMDKIAAEASKAGLSLEAALRVCCSRGWQGFEAEWVAGKPGSANSNKFRVAHLDHTSSNEAMAASIKRHNITIPADGEIEF